MCICECPFTVLFVQDVLIHHKESLEEVTLHGHDVDVNDIYKICE